MQCRYELSATRYELEVLHQCGKRVKTKSQKALGAYSYISSSYRGETGWGGGIKLLTSF